MPLLWVEVDHPDGEARDAFAHVRIAPYARTLPWPDLLPPDVRRALVLRGCALLLGRPLSSANVATVDQCMASAPEGAVLMHANVLPPRDPRAVRLEYTLRPVDVLPYLEAVRWPGDPAPVREVLGWHSEDVVRSHALILTIVDGAVQPRISLEPHTTPYRPRAAWRQVFQRAVSDCGALPDKVAGLEGWLGRSAVDDPRLGWPGVITRGFDFKYVVGADGGLTSKVYLVWHTAFRVSAITQVADVPETPPPDAAPVSLSP